MRRILLFLTIFLIVKLAAASQRDYPFKVHSHAVPGGQVLMAENKGPAPILATVRLPNPVNFAVDQSSPITLVVKPNEYIQITTMHIMNPVQGYRVATSYKFSIGDPDVAHDPNAMYQLPFLDGQTTTIGQAWGGKITTHTTPDSRYAVDFTVPIGAPVLAARKGRVVDVDQGFIEGGPNPLLEANHVLILHEDGTLGLYSHLDTNRITVTFGQSVEAGTLIGYSGNTGYSTGPHLHFSVMTNTQSADGTAKYVSVPVKFVNYSPVQEFQLFQGDKLVVSHNGPPPKGLPAYTGRHLPVLQPTQVLSPAMP